MKKVCEMFAEKQNGDEIGTRNKQKQLMRIFFPKEEELIDDAKEIVPADCAIPTRRVAIGDTAKALEIRFSKDLAGVIQLPQNQMTAENTAEDKRFSQSFSSENAVGKKHENVDHFPNDHCCGQSSISAHDNSTFHTYNVILPQSMSKSLQLGIKRIFTGREWEKLISVYKSGKKSKFDEKGDGDDDSVAFYDSCLRVDGEDEDVYDDTEITTTEWENVENSAGETDEYSVATELGRATIDILLSAVNDKPIPHSREEDNSLDGGMSSSVGDSLDYGDEHMSHSDEHESLLEEGQAMLNHLLCTVMQSGSRRRKLTSSSSNERKSKRAKRPKISQYYASTTGTSASETKRRPLSTEKDNLGGDHESVSVLSGVGRATLDSLLSKALNINPRRVSKKKIVDGGGSGKFLHAATHDSEGIIWDEWPTSSAEPSTFSVKEDKKISVAPQAVDRADPNFLLSRADEQDSVKIAIPSLKRKRKVAKSPTQELDKSSLRRVTKANELDDSSVTSNAGRDTLASLLAKAKSTSGVTDAQN